VDCWLAGEERGSGGAFTRQLHQLVEELEIGSQVRFLGFREDGPELLRAADFFLLPSTHEGLPLSIVEAQAVGAVVVASPLPGIREVVEEGVTGFLVDPANPRGYADRIKTLLAKRDLREEVTRNARAHVARAHTWRHYTERVWQLYADVVAGRIG
jgi:glycosyltransferase involved in cell wall biosynthesis